MLKPRIAPPPPWPRHEEALRCVLCVALAPWVGHGTGGAHCLRGVLASLRPLRRASCAWSVPGVLPARAEGDVNHCVDCGRLVTRGHWHTVGANAVRCLVCQTMLVMQGWKFETAVMKLRKEAKRDTTYHLG